MTIAPLDALVAAVASATSAAAAAAAAAAVEGEACARARASVAFRVEVFRRRRPPFVLSARFHCARAPLTRRRRERASERASARARGTRTCVDQLNHGFSARARRLEVPRYCRRFRFTFSAKVAAAVFGVADSNARAQSAPLVCR